MDSSHQSKAVSTKLADSTRQDEKASRRAGQKRKQLLPGWVALGLVAVSVGISLLELIANLFGKLSLLPLPGLSAIVLYLALAYLQPRLFPWPRWRIPYLILLFAVTLAVGALALPAARFTYAIAVYGAAAHARVNFGKKGGWAVEVVIAAAVLLGMIFMGGVALEEPLRREIVQLGIEPRQAAIPLQFGIWLLGLIFVDIFTGLGTQERMARLRSDELVEELISTQEQLRAYALRAEELATMRERTRVAREVHDTLAQGLAAIKMHLETGVAMFEERPDLAIQHMQRARDLAGEHLGETRNSILALRIDALDGQTLPTALASLAATWKPNEESVNDPATKEALRCAQGDNGGEAMFCVSGIAQDAPIWSSLSPAVELACYRVAQEALSNATKHGRASHVDMELSVESEELCLTITDDGIGFDLTAISSESSTGGFGIIGMHERMKLLNGRLEVISAPQTGTQVVAMIPLKAISPSQAVSTLKREGGKQIIDSYPVSR